MKLNDVLQKECIAAGVTLKNKTEALLYIAQTAKKSPTLTEVSQNEILEGLQARESLGSTGIGKGIAIPHCRLKSVKNFVVGVITVPSGVDFDSLDGEKARLIVFIIAPEVESNQHLKLLSAISQSLLAPKALHRILAEQTPDGIYESFLYGKDVEINGREQVDKSLIHVFIQSEDIFRNIIQIFTGMESSSIVIVAAENASVYLSKIPLFASFWSDEPSDFGRIIIAVVDKNLTNEALRRIESVAGDLNKCTGVMVIVQDVSYAAGSLGT
jgi:PTS system nitrogen regulatory IIA component